MKKLLKDKYDEIPKSFEMIRNITHLNLREKFPPFKFLIA